jgi:hypothetical protein
MSTRSKTARRGVLAVATVAVAAPTATLALAADGPAPTTTLPAVSLAASSIGIHEQIKLAGHDLAERRVMRVARKVAKLRGDRLPRGYARRIDSYTVAELVRKHRRLSRTLRTLRERKRTGGAPAVAIPAQLAAIAACESGGNPRAIGGGGAYRGKYQFSYSTWAGVGGSGDPAAASETEQDRRAAMLYARSGAGQWPVCGR